MSVALRTTKTDDGDGNDVERDALIAKWVETAPGYLTPDRARIIGHGVSVTALLTQLQLENGDADAVLNVYQLPSEALDAAIAYYERNKAVIDARIVLNAARFAGYDFSEDANSHPLIARWVETAPGYDTPDRARIVGHGVSVTALITQVHLEGGNTDEVLKAYELPAEALDAAIAYYERNKAVIDAKITLNTSRFAG